MLTFLDFNKIPRPKSSTPQLLLTHVKPLTLVSFNAFIKFSGIPHKPNPPTNNVELSGISLIASAAVSYI